MSIMRAYIKEVKITNYKTYKNARIRFSDGINTIVGPNGTGKSNSIEAILFGLGERSLKLFRANKFIDIVHNPQGVDITKKGYEVSVTLTIVDDKGKEHIFKRVFRPKDNAHLYYYNKKRVSRGTYISKLLTLGGGGFHYVYIPQGGILNQANITPKDLKQLIDEALGIAKFDEKKAEALSRLEKAEAKLEALNEKQEILKEMVSKLLHQMINLEKKENIERVLRRLKAAKYTLEIEELEPKINKKKEELEELSEKENRYTKRIAQLENDIQSVERKIGELEEELEEKGIEQYRKMLRERSNINTDLTNKKNLLNLKENALQREEKELDYLRLELNRIRDQVKEKTDSLKTIVKTNRSLKKELTSLNKEKEKLTKEIERLQNELGEIFSKKKELISKRDKTLTEKIREQAEILALEKIGDLYRDRLKELEDKLAHFEKNMESLEGKLNEIKEKLSGIKDREKKLKEKYDKFRARKEKIEREIREAEKLLRKVEKYIDKIRREKKTVDIEYQSDARYIMKIASDMNIKGVIGILGERIKGPKDIVSLLKESLGRDWYSIIVDDVDTAEKLFKISYELNKKVMIKPVSRYVSSEKPHDKSVLTVIKYPSKMRPLLTKLFGNLVIITDPEEGYRYLSQGLSVIHKKGEFMITTDSWIYEGKKKRIIITKDLEKLEDIYKTFKDMITLRKDDLDRLETEIDHIENNLIKLISERVRLEETVKIMNENMRFLKSFHVYYKRRRNKILRNLRKEGKKEKLAKVEKEYISEVSRLDRTIDDYRMKISKLEEEKKEIEVEIVGIENILTRNNEFINSTREAIQEIKRNRDRIKESIREKVDEINRIKREISSIKKEIREKEKYLEEINREIDEFVEKTEGIKQRLEKLKHNRSEINRKWVDYNKRLNEVKIRISEIKGDLKNLSTQINMLREKRAEEGYLEPVHIPGVTKPEEIEFMIREYMDEMDEINRDENYPTPMAREEYLRRIEPYKQFSMNKSQLEKERNAILEFIREIDDEKERVFREGFEKIKAKFEKLFYSVFPESKIVMDLENPEDINSGIILYVELKGKPRLPIFSLSGGEKSLLIILFLLAVYSIPGNVVFLLDEIDAHVDPRNLNHFAQAIVSQKEESQIIFVTLPRDEILAKMADYLITIFFRNGVSRPIVIPKERISEVLRNR